MKDAIREYIYPSHEEKEALWRDAMFVFDTNIFLNLYRYTAETRKALLQSMKKISDRIWMPKQVAQEFMRRRPGVVFEITDAVNKSVNDFKQALTMKLRRGEDDADIRQLSAILDRRLQLFKRKSKIVEDLNDDIVLNEILQLFEGKVGEGFAIDKIKEIEVEGKWRYENKIPPGYKDDKKDESNNKYGDLIIWKEIIEFSKNNHKNIIFVTGDQKEDWWQQTNGRTLGPRIELKKEFYEETGCGFYMYNMEGFLKHSTSGANMESKVIDEIKLIERSNSERRQDPYRKILPRGPIASLERKIDELVELYEFLTQKENETRSTINTIKHRIVMEENIDGQDSEAVKDLELELLKNKARLIKLKEQRVDCSKEILLLRQKYKERYNFE